MRTSDKMLFKRMGTFIVPPMLLALALGLLLHWDSHETGGAFLLGACLGMIAYGIVDGPAISRGERPEVTDPESLDRL